MPTRTMMTILDDKAGEGTELAFPQMSTCAAVIAVLPDRLVGVHTTQGNAAAGGRQKRQIFNIARQLLNGQVPSRLYIVGWSTSVATRHDLTTIRGEMQCNGIPTYYCDLNNAQTVSPFGNPQTAFRAQTGITRFRKRAIDVCTFAFHRPGPSAEIGLKRTTKVAWQHLPTHNQDYTQRRNLYGRDVAEAQGEMARVTTPSDHLHRLGANDFIQVP